MPGPPPKQPSRRIRRATKAIGVIGAAGKAPRMPSGLCSAAQTAWTAYWSDTVSGVMHPSDTTVAIRWVRNLSRYLILIAEADREPLVVGYAGQTRGNPAYGLAFKIEESIKDDEKQLGIGPANRLRLGVVLSESAKTLAEMNKEAAADAAGTDPRAALIALAGNSPDAAELPATD
jgi:hypothetical protein